MENTSTYQPGAGANDTGGSPPSQAKQQLQDMTQQAKGAAGNLAEQPMPLGRYAGQAAELVDRIVGRAENLARRSPAVFFGAAFAIGFMAARFLKSTAPTGPSMAYEGYSGSRSTPARYDAPYYREHETIGKSELHEREGYHLKTAAERALELQAARPAAATNTGSGFTYGGSPDMNDDELSSDFAESTRARSSDV